MILKINVFCCLGLLFVSHFTRVSTSTLPINWTLATFTNLVLERQYTYPAYNEVAPSPCDLTQDFCDLFCCSDVDCSPEERASFPCIEPRKATTTEDPLSCDSHQHQRPPWFSLFCHVSSNTPLLGRFFDLRPSFASLAAMKEAISPLEEAFSFASSRQQLQPPSMSNEDDGYRYGKPIRIFRRTSAEVSDWGHLSVPRNVQGRCGKSLPVGYLVDVDAVCVEVVTRERCEEGAALGGFWYYAVASTGDSGYCEDQQQFDQDQQPGLPLVSADGLRATPVDTSTEFLRFCNRSEHLTFSRSLDGDEVRRLLQSSNDENSTCGEYGYDVDSGPGLSTMWFDESTGICRNVVVSVEYRFIWKGPQLKKLTARYVLVDIPTTLMNKEVDSDQDPNGAEDLFVPMADGDLTFFVTRKFKVNFQYEVALPPPNVTAAEDGGGGSGDNTSTTATGSRGDRNSVTIGSATGNRGRSDGHFTVGSLTMTAGEEELAVGNGTDGYHHRDESAVYMWSGGE